MEEEEEEVLDSELLILPDNSFITPPSPPQLLQRLFSHWISLPNSSNLVKALIEYAGDTNLTSNTSLLPSRNPPSDFKHEPIPQFYFPHGRQPTSEVREGCLKIIDRVFAFQIHGLSKSGFGRVTKHVCGLPFFLSASLFNKIVTDGSSKVTRDAFIQYWVRGNMLTLDKPTQIFNILKQPHCNYLTQADFVTLLGELCTFHPGLDFLNYSPDSAAKSYAATVLFRIFYYINRSKNDRITLRELKRGDLVAAMQHADKAADINKVVRYFSYDHAAVIYEKFRELVADRNDPFIVQRDLATYNDNALTGRILDRIFLQVPRRFKSNIKGTMCYEDFVYFILAEEDKQSEPSLEYWFKCIDLDGNGILTCDELKYFYQEQISRMELIGMEIVSFEDMLDRVFDMIAPEAKEKEIITWQDVKASKLSGEFFNILFNIKKSIPEEAYELNRADQMMRTEMKNLEKEKLREWDLFALREYQKLCMDNDSDDERDLCSTEGECDTGSDSFEDDVTSPVKKQKVVDKGKGKMV